MKIIKKTDFFKKSVCWNYFTKVNNRRKIKKHQAGDEKIVDTKLNRWSTDYNLISWTNLTLFDEYLEMGKRERDKRKLF